MMKRQFYRDLHSLVVTVGEKMREVLLFISSVTFVQGIFKHEMMSPIEVNNTETYLYKLKKHQIDCIDLTRVDPDNILKLKAGHWSINSSPLKLWVLCVLNKMGLMSTEGVFKLDVALATIPAEDRPKAEKIIDTCLSTKTLPPSEIAWRYITCHNKMDKYHNLTTLGVLGPWFDERNKFLSRMQTTIRKNDKNQTKWLALDD